MEVRVPLIFRPVYQSLVWGGRRMAAWGRALPDGPIGESWELADHSRGMSVVAAGPFAGRSLRELVLEGGSALVGDGFSGGEFPLMVKLIDARDRLSVQVHPDAEIARKLGVGQHGKTECWVFLEDGGEIFHGTSPGVDRLAFERALAEGNVATTLNRFAARKGDVFFLPARTVHALGEGCLLYEVQQTSDITFRIYDWDRLGLDGKPRPLHVSESLATIDFSRGGFGPHKPEAWRSLEGPLAGQIDGSAGCRTRVLVDCAHFSLQEQTVHGTVEQLTGAACAVVTCLTGQGTLSTDGGEVAFLPMQTVLVPAAAGRWRLSVSGDEAHAEAQVLVATPKF
jgi:mannose-6-phosphate isomerase